MRRNYPSSPPSGTSLVDGSETDPCLLHPRQSYPPRASDVLFKSSTTEYSYLIPQKKTPLPNTQRQLLQGGGRQRICDMLLIVFSTRLARRKMYCLIKGRD